MSNYFLINEFGKDRLRHQHLDPTLGTKAYERVPLHPVIIISPKYQVSVVVGHIQRMTGKHLRKRDRAAKWIVTIQLIFISFLFSCASNQIQNNSALADAYFKLGTEQLQNGEYDNAVLNLNKALEINSKYAEAYLIRGIAYRQKGNYDQAISDYSRSLEIDAKDVRAYCNRGNVYVEKGLYDQAVSDYSKALKMNPRLGIVYYDRGMAYYLKGEYRKSWEDAHMAEELGFEVPTKFLDDLSKALEGQK